MRKIYCLFSLLCANFLAYSQPGIVDKSFSLSGPNYPYTEYFERQSDGKFILTTGFPNGSTMNRYGANGIVEASFFDDLQLTHGLNDFVYPDRGVLDLNVLPDDKILIAGAFGIYDGTYARNNIARLLSNGKIDPEFTFAWGIPAEEAVTTIFFNNADELILGGLNIFFRVNNNGAVDETFAPNHPILTALQGAIETIDQFDNNKYLIGGNFGTYSTNKNLVRCLSTGNIDPTWNIGSGFNNTVREVIIQPDQKILVRGDFTQFNGTPITGGLCRLNEDGTLDPTFNIATGFTGLLYDMIIQADGKIILGGSFMNYNGYTNWNIVRLNTDGSPDTSFGNSKGIDAFAFSPGVKDMELLPDSKLFVCGPMTRFLDAAGNNMHTSQGIMRLFTCSSPFTVSGLQTLEACGTNNGAVSLSPTGGTGPYTYTSITGTINGNILTGLNGSYQIKVTDKDGCSATNTVSITECNSVITVSTLSGENPVQNITGAYLSLVKNNTILQTRAINNGVAVFDPVPLDTYKLVMHTNSEGSLTPLLPANFSAFLGEGLVGSTGDMNPNGILEIVISQNSITVNNNAKVAASGEVFFSLEASTLPIRLKSFSGKSISTGNLLKWETEAEVDFSHFEVERSSSLAPGGGTLSPNFEKIGQLAGSSSEAYEYLDSTPPPGAGGLYRLKMIDLDGKYSYSKIIFIENKNEKTIVGQFYPNPSQGKTSIEINALENGNWTISTFDLTGKIINKEIKVLQKGINKISVESLGKGVNFVRFENGVVSEIRKVVKE